MVDFKQKDSPMMNFRSFTSLIVKYFEAGWIVEIVPVDVAVFGHAAFAADT